VIVHNLVALGIAPHFQLILLSSKVVIPHFRLILSLKVNAFLHFDDLYQRANNHVFSTQYELDPAMTFHPSEEAVGIDLGVKSFAVLSNGSQIANPRFYRHTEEKIKEAHRKIHRRKQGSHRRHRAKKELSRLYRKVGNRRRDFLHKASRKLVSQYATLVFEDLHIDNMTKAPAPKQDENGRYVPNGAAAKSGLNKSILEAGWGAFVTLCSSKAEEAGCCVVKVAPHKTSQACSGCERIVEKDLSVRWHSCPHCGTQLDRDHNAALNILHRYHNEKQDGAGSVPHKPLRVRSARGTV
jgi:putative transposase